MDFMVYIELWDSDRTDLPSEVFVSWASGGCNTKAEAIDFVEELFGEDILLVRVEVD